MTSVTVPVQQLHRSSQGQQGDAQLRQRQTQQPVSNGPAAPWTGPPMNRPAGQQPQAEHMDGARAVRVLPPSVLDATTTKVLVPSRAAVYALLAVPLVLWAGSVLLGIAHEELPDGLSKRDFEHPLLWFDRHVFRVYGPLLPLLPLLLRCAALGLRIPLPSHGHSAAATSSGLGRKQGGAAEAGPWGSSALRPCPSLPLQAVLVYAVVIAVRIALYVGHLAVQRASLGALMSDHLLLAASVVACFQAEMVLCLSDVFKVELLSTYDPGASVRQVTVCAAMVTSMFLLVFVYGDMYCTARWYHQPAESMGALLTGAAVFNLPVAVWIASHIKRSS